MGNPAVSSIHSRQYVDPRERVARRGRCRMGINRRHSNKGTTKGGWEHKKGDTSKRGDTATLETLTLEGGE